MSAKELTESVTRLRAVLASSTRVVYGDNGALVRDDLSRVLNAVAPMQKPLTAKQREVFEFIRSSITTNGYSPTFEVIATHFGFKSLASVAEHIDNIERKGWIRREFNRQNGIYIVERAA